MKKLMFIMMMLLGFVATSSSVYAHSVSVQSAEDIEGSYTGSLTKVYMNGDKSPVSPIETVVTSNGDGTYNFHIDAFQVGKMPGTITVDAKNIEISSANSTFTATCTNAVNLKIFGFIPAKYTAYVTGSIENGKLIYTLTVNAEYSSAPFTAIVTFEGNWASDL